MSGITVIVVPTWAIFIFFALAIASIVSNAWALWLRRKLLAQGVTE